MNFENKIKTNSLIIPMWNLVIVDRIEDIQLNAKSAKYYGLIERENIHLALK